MNITKSDCCHLDHRERSLMPLYKIPPYGRDDIRKLTGQQLMFIHNTLKVLAVPVLFSIVIFTLMTGSAIADAEEKVTAALPDKFMFRLGGYFVDGSKTSFSVNSDILGLGSTIDFSKDLGGDERDKIPRFDFYYRFNNHHRIDYTWFSIDRKGTRELTTSIQIGDTVFVATDVVHSEIKYTLHKLGYSYSLYHTPKIELAVSIGLNVMSYDLGFSTDLGVSESVGVTLPLPVYGVRVGYSFTPNWSVHFVSETFVIDYQDKLVGSLLNYEVNTEYRLFKNFAIGAGLARLGLHADVNTDSWSGAVSDNYRGFTAFGVLYF